MCKFKKAVITKTVLKTNKAGDLILLHIKINYCKATVIKTVWFGDKDRQADEWNRIESSETCACASGPLICNKSDKSDMMKNTEE